MEVVDRRLVSLENECALMKDTILKLFTRVVSLEKRMPVNSVSSTTSQNVNVPISSGQNPVSSMSSISNHSVIASKSLIINNSLSKRKIETQINDESNKKSRSNSDSSTSQVEDFTNRNPGSSKSISNFKNLSSVICPTCDKTFRWPSELRRHMETHEPKKFDCLMCSKSYKLEKSFEQHIKEWHTDSNFNCDKCREKFKTKYELSQHTEQKHSDVRIENNFICGICGSGFKYPSLLKEHIVGHGKQHKGKFECPICHRQFKYERYIQPHVKLMHSERIKTLWCCKRCCARFRTRWEYNEHKKIHELDPKIKKPLQDTISRIINKSQKVPSSNSEIYKKIYTTASNEKSRNDNLEILKKNKRNNSDSASDSSESENEKTPANNKSKVSKKTSDNESESDKLINNNNDFQTTARAPVNVNKVPQEDSQDDDIDTANVATTINTIQQHQSCNGNEKSENEIHNKLNIKVPQQSQSESEESDESEPDSDDPSDNDSSIKKPVVKYICNKGNLNLKAHKNRRVRQ